MRRRTPRRRFGKPRSRVASPGPFSGSFNHRVQAANDLGRRATLSDERDALARELAAAVGLGGRARRAGSLGERARLNVTRALKSTLARIAVVHPALGEHLSRGVRTGIYCAYRPDPRAPMLWRILVLLVTFNADQVSDLGSLLMLEDLS